MTNRVSVIVVAGPHSLFGAIEHRRLRMLDVLSDVSSNYLQLHSVTVRRGIDGQCISQPWEVTLPKSALDFVLLEADKYEAPLRRTYTVVAKQPRAALILVGDYEIRGQFMIKGSFDGLPILCQEPIAYFPVTRARISRITNADPLFQPEQPSLTVTKPGFCSWSGKSFQAADALAAVDRSVDCAFATDCPDALQWERSFSRALERSCLGAVCFGGTAGCQTLGGSSVLFMTDSPGAASFVVMRNVCGGGPSAYTAALRLVSCPTANASPTTAKIAAIGKAFFMVPSKI